MQKQCLFIFPLFTLLAFGQLHAEPVKLVEKDFFWSSSNLTEVPPVRAKQDPRGPRSKKAQPIKAQSYRNYFDQHGTHPPYPFLRSMKEGDPSIAEIWDDRILFKRTGKKIDLNTSRFPQGAHPAPPYLLSTPHLKWVLAVYPYYLHQDKENRYLTEVYTDRGNLAATYDSLPTHVSINNPDLFISPERSGCCESLKWSIRFFDPQHGSSSEYSCPEGFCGDVLFTRLGDKGPFLIVQEIVGRVEEIGASMQTNFYIVDSKGKLSASGKTLYAMREPDIDKQRVESLSPYAISHLFSAKPLSEKDQWIIHFGEGGQSRALKLTLICRDLVPSIVFLLPKDPSATGKKGSVRVLDQLLGDLPLLLVSSPGQMTFEVFSENGQKETISREIKSDVINILIF